MEYKDYYKILGVDRKAAQKDIKAAYRKLAKKHHPDQTGGNADRFKDLNEAYEVLGDADKRDRYDSLGNSWQHGSGFNPPPGYGGGQPQWQTTGSGGAVNIEDILGGFGAGFGGSGGASGFSDFFEAMFGGRGGGGRSASAGMPYGATTASRAPGGHAGGQRHTHTYSSTSGPPAAAAATQPELSLEIPLETVIKGGTHHFYNPYTGQNGEVSLPKGVKQGAKVRLANQGPVMASGQRRPLLIAISYQPQERFQVEGLNLVLEVPVAIDVLALGGEVSVQTLGQGTITLTVPAESQPDRKMRLKGLGLPSGNLTGDLMVVLKAQLPSPLTSEIRAVFEQLRQSRLNRTTSQV